MINHAASLPTMPPRYIQSAGTVLSSPGAKNRTATREIQMTWPSLRLHHATLGFPSHGRAGGFTNEITSVNTTPRSLVPYFTGHPTSS